MSLDKIKARLGSIAPAKMNTFPISVQKLLERDMPRLIEIVEAILECDIKTLVEKTHHFEK